jgi:hypothetical protein
METELLEETNLLYKICKMRPIVLSNKLKPIKKKLEEILMMPRVIKVLNIPQIKM